jgi:hypothetical protein
MSVPLYFLSHHSFSSRLSLLYCLHLLGSLNQLATQIQGQCSCWFQYLPTFSNNLASRSKGQFSYLLPWESYTWHSGVLC